MDLQRVWDDAALLAHRGQPLTEIVSRMVDNTSPDVSAGVLAAVPRYGRTFWVSMIKTLLAAAVMIGLLLFMKSFARPLPGLTAVLCTVIGIVAVAAGTMAGRQRVRNRRLSMGTTQRATVSRVAAEAARAVWTAEVPGSWAPSGPPPDGSLTARAVPQAWLRRWGDDGADVPAVTVSGAITDLRAALARQHGPVVVFVRGSGVDPEMRSIADERGLAVFRLSGAAVTPASATAEAVWSAYRSAETITPPAELFRQRWQPA